MSQTIPPGSLAGTLLKGIFNFSPATTVLEAIAWLAYVVPTMWLFLYQGPSSLARPRPPSTAEPVPSGRK